MNNKTKLSLAILSVVALPLQLMAVDLGLAGSISAMKESDSGFTSGVNDLRLKAVESINNTTKVNVVANIQDGFSINEGYLTFSKPLSVLGLNYDIAGLEVIAGQKLVSFGVDNTRYTEDRAFIGRPAAVSELVGDSRVGKGVEVGYVLPVSLPLKVSVGYQLDEKTASDSDFTRTKATTARLALTQKNYTAGVSMLSNDNGNDTDSRIGVDGSYKMDLGIGTLNLEGEFISYAPGDSSAESRTGYYLYAGYDWKNSWTTGLVFDAASADTKGDDDYTAFSLVAARKLSDSAKLRFQYTSNNKTTDDSTIAAQIVFNLK